MARAKRTWMLAAGALSACAGSASPAAPPATAEAYVASTALFPDVEHTAALTDPDEDRFHGDADRCPWQPETINGTDDSDGCPDRGCPICDPWTPEDFGILSVYFRQGSSRIASGGDRILRVVARELEAHPGVTEVVVVGHSDAAEGRPALAERRARAAVDALVGLGIARNRLRPLGVDALCPRDPRRRARSRARNRRVDFRIARWDVGPSELPVVCDAALHLLEPPGELDGAP